MPSLAGEASGTVVTPRARYGVAAASQACPHLSDHGGKNVRLRTPSVRLRTPSVRLRTPNVRLRG